MRQSAFITIVALLFSCSPDNDTIKIKGSDTEVNLAVRLAEIFHNTNAEDYVSVSGGGSGLGIAALLNGTADLANSSRPINDDEMQLFHEKGITLDSFIFATDAIAFVVSDAMPIDSISTSDLAAILSGKITHWSSFGLKKMRINIYGRQSNSGTHDFIKNKLGINFTPYAKQMNGNAQILEAIKADKSGIGYVGAGYVSKNRQRKVKVLSIFQKNDPAISPFDTTMIADGRYFFQRPLYQYFRTDSYGKVKSFLEFEGSSTGKSVIQASGYYITN
jgi:phosphate transport system substrate-binding protein